MSVSKLYRNAWRLESHETQGQRLLDVWISIAAPSVALWATVNACLMYWNEEDRLLAVSLILLGAMLSLVIFVFACHILMRPPRNLAANAANAESAENQPRKSVMLAFAAWLFHMGLAFTLAETYDHFWGPIGPLKNLAGVRGEFDSPWGDVLLAFSAFCMLVEEFSLFNLYGAVEKDLGAARKQYLEARRSSKAAEENAEKIYILYGDAEKDRKKINRICDQTKRYFEDVESMRRKMRKEQRPIRVFLKQCFVSFMVGVAIWTLALVLHNLTTRLEKLETANRTVGDTVETSGDSEVQAPEDESEDAGDQGQTSVDPATNDTGESSTADPIGSPSEDGEDTSRSDDLDDTADGTTPTR